MRLLWLPFVLLLGASTSACGTSWYFRPSTNEVQRPAVTAAALRIYAADVEKVEHADGAVILGEMRVDGDPYASFDGVRERASIEAAKLGGTHFTLLSQWTQGRSAHSPHAIYVVVRVPREGWDSLPAQLRPRPL